MESEKSEKSEEREKSEASEESLVPVNSQTLIKYVVDEATTNSPTGDAPSSCGYVVRRQVEEAMKEHVSSRLRLSPDVFVNVALDQLRAALASPVVVDAESTVVFRSFLADLEEHGTHAASWQRFKFSVAHCQLRFGDGLQNCPLLKVLSSRDMDSRKCLPLATGGTAVSTEPSTLLDRCLADGFQQLPHNDLDADSDDGPQQLVAMRLFAKGIVRVLAIHSRCLHKETLCDVRGVQVHVDRMLGDALVHDSECRARLLATELGLDPNNSAIIKVLELINNKTLANGYDAPTAISTVAVPLPQTFESEVTLKLQGVAPICVSDVKKEACLMPVHFTALRDSLKALFASCTTPPQSKSECVLRFTQLLAKYGFLVSDDSVLTSAARDKMLADAFRFEEEKCYRVRKTATTKVMAALETKAINMFVDSHRTDLERFCASHSYVLFKVQCKQPLVLAQMHEANVDNNTMTAVRMVKDGHLIKCPTNAFETSSTCQVCVDEEHTFKISPVDLSAEATYNATLALTSKGTLIAERVLANDAILSGKKRCFHSSVALLRLLYTVEEKHGLQHDAHGEPLSEFVSDIKALDTLTFENVEEYCKSLSTDGDNFIGDATGIVNMLLHRRNRQDPNFTNDAFMGDTKLCAERNRRRYVSTRAQTRIYAAAKYRWQIAYTYFCLPTFSWRQHNTNSTVVVNDLHAEDDPKLIAFFETNPGLKRMFDHHLHNLTNDTNTKFDLLSVSEDDREWSSVIAYAAAYKKPPVAPYVRKHTLVLLKKQPFKLLSLFDALLESNANNKQRLRVRRGELREESMHRLSSIGCDTSIEALTPLGQLERSVEHANVADIAKTISNMQVNFNPTHISWESNACFEKIEEHCKKTGEHVDAYLESQTLTASLLYKFFQYKEVPLPSLPEYVPARPSVAVVSPAVSADIVDDDGFVTVVRKQRTRRAAL
jgi:hypothetical protein